MDNQKKYIITERQLREFLLAYHTLNALESYGVDNWEWYGESLDNYLEDEELDDLVNKEILNYKEVV